MNPHVKRLTALNYFGGKVRHLDWIFKYLPPRETIHVFMEGFCGSAAFTLNVEPYPIEIINDIDDQVWNFFTVCRNDIEALIEKLQMTPYSRKEFLECSIITGEPIEDARRFFIRSTQSFGGISHSTRRRNSFRIDIKQSRNGMAAAVSRFMSKIEGLTDVHRRLQLTQIDNRSIFYLLEKINIPDAFIYLDPPYRHDSRTGDNDYLHEFSDWDHFMLACHCNVSKAMIMISHYDDPLYDQFYTAPKWRKIYGPQRKSNLGKGADNGREVLYINYQILKQLNLWHSETPLSE
jgi:DNA adenine methylase